MIEETLPTLKEAWEYAYFGLLEDRPGVIDFYQRNIAHSFGNLLKAKSAVFDFNLGDLWLTPTKWTKFTGQYVDVESLHVWINNAKNVKTYDSMWNFKSVAPNFGGRRAVHQWGNCLLGFSFRRKPVPVLSLYTRAQSLGFSGVADYALSDFVARKLAQTLGIAQDQIQIEIHCANFMLKMIESIHYLTFLGRLEEFKARDDRIGESVRYYHKYLQQNPEDMTWRAAKRMRTKYYRILDGLHPDWPVAKLQLRGYDAHTDLNRNLSQEQASELVLAGKGRLNNEIEELVVDEDDEDL